MLLDIWLLRQRRLETFLNFPRGGLEVCGEVCGAVCQRPLTLDSQGSPAVLTGSCGGSRRVLKGLLAPRAGFEPATIRLTVSYYLISMDCIAFHAC